MPAAKISADKAKKKQARHRDAAVTVAGVMIVLVIVPTIFALVTSILVQLLLRILIGSWVDLLTFIVSPWDMVFGVSLGGVGFLYALWSFVSLYKIGRGTAFPFVPTTRLVVVGPYKYSRNPMVSGATIFYVGVGVIFHSITFIIFILIFLIAPWIGHIKLHEERGLVARFGDEYVKYKKQTRFMIPLPKRHLKK
jgi:protein-S-isoprenylcysteine O-methyltransferase Ste14